MEVLANTPWAAISAVLVVAFGAGGFLTQWVNARRDTAKTKLEDTSTQQVGFQRRLLRRIEKLESERDGTAAAIQTLRREHAECLQKFGDLEHRHGKQGNESKQLAGRFDSLDADHATLKRHLSRVEADNQELRARLKKLDPTGRQGRS